MKSAEACKTLIEHVLASSECNITDVTITQEQEIPKLSDMTELLCTQVQKADVLLQRTDQL